MADQAKFLSFMDMIDGGGAGKMGDKFEGGGIFSALANLIATPYGSEDEGRKRERMQALGLLDTQPAAAPAPQVVRGGGMTPAAPRTAPAPSYATMDMGEAGRGANWGYPLQNIPPAYEYGGNRPMMSMPAAPAYATMDMGEFGRGESVNYDPRNFAPNTQPSAGVDAPYNEFINRVQNDPLFAGIINDPVAMRNIFNMYQAQTQRMGQ